MPRLFVDVTATYNQGSRGGISRVTKSYVAALARRPGYDVVCFVHAGNGFYGVPADAIARPRALALLIRNVRAALRIRDYPRFPVYSILHVVWTGIAALRMRVLVQLGRATRIPAFERGDVVLLTFIPRHASFERVMRRLKRGERVAGIVHDMFPLQYGAHFIPEVRTIFTRGIDTQFRTMDLAIAVSNRTARAVRDHQRQRALSQPVKTVYLGADVGPARPRMPGVRPMLLSVGTCEPRKNYAYALAICEKLWAAGEDVHYTIVGSVDPGMPATAATIATHPEFGKRLFHLANADDMQLAGFYANSDGLLAVSLDEGFGLPVMEAWHYGLPVICSDIDIFRELRPDAQFVPLDDPAAAADIVRRALQRPSDVASTAARPAAFRSWDDAAAELCAAIETA